MAAMPHRPVAPAMINGLRLRCPACGDGKLFCGYLKVNEHCPSCHEELWHQRADDAPPYMVITIVGHIIVPALLAMEMALRPEIWIHIAIWIPLTLILCLLLLPPVKGALIGYQWAMHMHGFDPQDPEREHLPPSRRSAGEPPAKPAGA